MFCSQCGCALTNEARFCAGCGAKQTSPEHAIDQVYQAPPQARQSMVRPIGAGPTNPGPAAPHPAAPRPLPNYYQAPQVHVTQQVQVAAPAVIGFPKSVGAALALTFFLGPLGLFYSSVVGGVVMLIASVVFASFTFGVSLFITWPICMIWGAIAASNYNATLASRGHFIQINR